MHILRRRTVLDTTTLQKDNGKGCVICNGIQTEHEDYIRPKHEPKRTMFIKRNMDKDK